MDVWIVKHEPSGKYLPPLKAYTAATARELSDTPRVFYRRQDAVQAARWWAEGRAGWLFETDWETGVREPAGIDSVHVEGRNLSDLMTYRALLQPAYHGNEIKP